MPVVSRTKLCAEFVDSCTCSGQLAATVDRGDDLALDLPLTINDGATDQNIPLSGLTTLSALWIKSLNRTVTITLGTPPNASVLDVLPGGIVGFAGGSKSAMQAASVTYTPGDSTTAQIVVFATGS